MLEYQDGGAVLLGDFATDEVGPWRPTGVVLGRAVAVFFQLRPVVEVHEKIDVWYLPATVIALPTGHMDQQADTWISRRKKS
jgi:hypothetical protein